MYEFALVPGEFATWCRRALNERPYIRAVTIRFKFQFIVHHGKPHNGNTPTGSRLWGYP